MPIQTPQQYYEDPELYGDTQYVTLKDIIDGLLLETKLNEDHYLKNIKRALFIKYAKNAIREINKQAASEILQFEITVPESLTFPMPQECVDIVSVWTVLLDTTTGSYRLAQLDINNTGSINLAGAYLQDDQGDLLFDDQGQILQADGLNAFAQPYTRYRFHGYYQPTTDASKYSKHGEVSFNKSTGRMVFSSNLSNRDIVIRYVSDGLHATLSETQIRVHKYIRDSIETHVYWQGVRHNREVPGNEKQRARIDYNTALHKSKVSLASFDLTQIARAMRSRSMTL